MNTNSRRDGMVYSVASQTTHSQGKIKIFLSGEGGGWRGRGAPCGGGRTQPCSEAAIGGWRPKSHMFCFVFRFSSGRVRTRISNPLPPPPSFFIVLPTFVFGNVVAVLAYSWMIKHPWKQYTHHMKRIIFPCSQAWALLCMFLSRGCAIPRTPLKCHCPPD